VFKPGKNRDGYFDSKELIAQVDRAIDIFEDKINHLAQGLFMFDNAPSHLKRAADAISAKKMVKSAFDFFLLFSLINVPPNFPKTPSVNGHINQTGHTCAMVSIP
jgi:hypothetical protein